MLLTGTILNVVTVLIGTVIGLLSLAYLGADTLSNLVWGYTGDKTGFRRVMVLSLMIWIGVQPAPILRRMEPSVQVLVSYVTRAPAVPPVGAQVGE
mgnify:CR=1 FL=1